MQSNLNSSFRERFPSDKKAAWSLLSVSICVHLWFELNRYGLDRKQETTA